MISITYVINCLSDRVFTNNMNVITYDAMPKYVATIVFFSHLLLAIFRQLFIIS